MIWVILLVAFVALVSVMFGGWVVYRLRYGTRSRAYVVLVDPIRRGGEDWWAAYLDDGTEVFTSRDQDRAIAYALEWQAAELRRAP